MARFLAAEAHPLRDRYITLCAAGNDDREIAKVMAMPHTVVVILGRAARRLGAPPRPHRTSKGPKGASLRRQIADLLARGIDVHAIAQQLSIVVRTVREHRRAIEMIPPRRAIIAPQPQTKAALASSSPDGCAYPTFTGGCTAANVPGSRYCVEHGRRIYKRVDGLPGAST